MKCIACESTNFIKGPEKSVFNKSICVYRCLSCNLLLSNPVPTKLELQGYYASGEAQDQSGFDLQLLIDKHQEFVSNPPMSYIKLKNLFLKNTNILPEKANCLEIGCNLGVFIESVQSESSFIFYGIEFNTDAVNFVKKRDKFKISDQAIENEPFPDVEFDCIVMFDLLEHIPDPIEFISILKKRLTPNGVIIVAVPNADSAPSKLLRFFKRLKGKELFPTIDPPFHLYGYSLKNLEILFAKAGFQKLFHECYAMEYFDIDRQKNIDLPFNANRIIGSLLSSLLALITRDDKLVIGFKQKL